jgi:phage terminase small subunit
MNRAFKKEGRYFVWGVVYSFDSTASRELLYDYEQYLLDSYQKKYNIYINARDHLLKDRSKV